MNKEFREYFELHINELYSLEGKSFKTRIFSPLEKAIPDSTLEITEVFTSDELEQVWKNFDSHTSELGIAPIAEFYGNMVLCLGHERNNFGKVYYFDFDFGCIGLCDSLSEFSAHVQEG
jgi:hypothetical protein